MNYPLLILLAWKLATGDPGWQNFVHQQEERFTQWSKENDNNDFGRWLNDRVIELETPKDTKTFKAAAFWMALYAEKRQPLPKAINEICDEFDRLVRDHFSWDEIWKQIQEFRDRQKNADKRGKEK
jgi:hypothetical protein